MNMIADSSMSSTERSVGLALLTGKPRFAEPLHVGRPNLGNRAAFMERVNDILDRRWLSNDGPLLKEFERQIAHIVGVKHCVAMCNATVALEIAIRALGLRDEVIVPAYTFIATAHALQWQEIRPVFADMDACTHNMDAQLLERLITPRTTGIIGVHVWGRACDTDAIESLARRRRLKVMYDAAHAFGCTHKGRKIGGFGECEVFSFHATKFIHSFEGGAAVTNCDALAEKMRLMRNFGFAGYDHVIYPGTNGKMTEVCAAMGLTSLESMEAIMKRNWSNYECYRGGLSQLPGITLINYDARESNNYQYVIVEVDPDISPLNRDELVSVLHAENVLARKYFWPGCHQMEPYRSLQPMAAQQLPVTERVAARVLVLPTGQAVTTEMAHAISQIIREALAQNEQVKRVLSRSSKHF